MDLVLGFCLVGVVFRPLSLRPPSFRRLGLLLCPLSGLVSLSMSGGLGFPGPGCASLCVCQCGSPAGLSSFNWLCHLAASWLRAMVSSSGPVLRPRILGVLLLVFYFQVPNYPPYSLFLHRCSALALGIFFFFSFINTSRRLFISSFSPSASATTVLCIPW